MRIFQCQACGQPLSFENTLCESCGRALGYDCELEDIVTLERQGTQVVSATAPFRQYRFCVNAAFDSCNWLIPSHASGDYCVACRHNRVVPDLSVAWNRVRWRQMETAKHRLFYSLLRMRLPLATRPADPNGLAFDFLVDPAETFGPGHHVMTGHHNGLITLSITEADDVERERRRKIFGEHYRTLLGHFRHEIGHYFWNVLIRDNASLFSFRSLFGDERGDYGHALKRHYAEGPPPDWQNHHVSAYATAHPWEDFAETWAHYLHIVDTLETAAAFGLRIRPKLRFGTELAAVIDFDPHRVGDLDRLIEAWLPLTYAVNSLNRSMGQPDLYPFVLAPAVIEKLAFVHERIYAITSSRDVVDSDADTLRAVIAGLRTSVAAPNPR